MGGNKKKREHRLPDNLNLIFIQLYNVISCPTLLKNNRKQLEEMNKKQMEEEMENGENFRKDFP